MAGINAIFWEVHKFHCAAKEIYGGDLVDVLKIPERMDFILDQIYSTQLDETGKNAISVVSAFEETFPVPED
jgi:hypothetical protein